MKKREIYVITADFLDGFDPKAYYASVQSEIRGREKFMKKGIPLTPREIEETREMVVKRNFEISQEVKKNKQLFDKYPKLREIVAKLAVEYLNKANGDKSLAQALLLAGHSDDNVDISVEGEHLS